MSSKKFKKSNNTIKSKVVKNKLNWKAVVARVIIVMLCIAVVVTLIPSVFF